MDEKLLAIDKIFGDSIGAVGIFREQGIIR